MSQHRYAILIGSSEYPKDPALLPLSCPSRDVEGLNEILSSPEHGKFDKIYTFVNAPHYQIIRDLNFILRQADRDDLILIYYSGHGKLDPLGRLHLATIDTELDALEGTSIPVANIKNYIDVSRSKEIILILDCCYSGRIRDAFIKGGADEQLRGTFVKGGVEEQLQQVQSTQDGKGIYILTASTGIQVAQEKEGDKFSLFTKHIIEGIRGGKADIDDDGKVSVHDLYRYTYEQMRKETNMHYPMRWDVHVEGHELVVAYTGRVPGQKQRDKIRSVVVNLYANKILPHRILVEATEMIEGDAVEPTVADVTRHALLSRLAENQIEVPDFIDRWYASVKKSEEDAKQTSLRRLLNDARAAVGQESWAHAIELLNSLLTLDPNYPEARALLNEAETQLQLLTDYNAGLTYSEAGQWAEALASFERILARDSDYKDARRLADGARSEMAKAAAEKERWLKVENLLQKSESELAAKDWDAAIRNLEAVVALAPDHSPALARLDDARELRLRHLYDEGRGLLKAKRWQGAVKCLRLVQETRDGYRDTDELIEEAQAGLREAQEAVRRRAEIATLREAAERLITVQDWQNAADRLQSILAIDASDAEAAERLSYVRTREELHGLYVRGQEHLASGRWDEALKLLLKIQHSDGGYKDVVSLVARAEEHKRREAESLFSKIEESLKEKDWGAASATLNLVPAGDHGEQVAEYARRIDEGRREQELEQLYTAARQHYEAGRWQEVVTHARKLVLLAPNYKDVATLIAKAQAEIERLEREGQRQREQEAKTEASRLLQAAAGDVQRENWERAVQKLTEASSLDGANEEITSALLSAQRRLKTDALYEQGRSYAAAGEYKHALDNFKRVVNRTGEYKDTAELIEKAEEQLKRSRRRALRTRLLILSAIGVAVLLVASFKIFSVSDPAGSTSVANTSTPDTGAPPPVLRAEFKPLYQIVTPLGALLIELSADGQIIASITENPLMAHFWQRGVKGELVRLGNSLSNCGAVAISPTEAPVGAYGCSDGSIQLISLSDSRSPTKLKSEFGRVFVLRFSADGRTLVSGSVHPETFVKTVQVWGLGKGWKLKHMIPIGSTEKVSAVSADHNMVAVTTSEGIELRSLVNNTVLRRLEDSRNIEGNGVFSRDGQSLAVAVDGGARILMWGVKDGRAMVKPFERETGSVRNVALSPDGQIVVGGFSDGSIQVWRVSDGQSLALLKSHAQEVRGLSFSVDGKLMASASADGIIKMWQVSTEQ